MIGGNYAGTTAQIGLGALRKAAIPQNQPNLGVLMGEAIDAYNKKKENEDLLNKQQAYADALKSGDQDAIKNAWIDLDAAGYADYANKQAEVEAQRAFQEKMQQQAFNNQWGLAKFKAGLDGGSTNAQRNVQAMIDAGYSPQDAWAMYYGGQNPSLNLANLGQKGQEAYDKALGGDVAKNYAEDLNTYNNLQANLPELEKMVDELAALAPKATHTKAGRVTDVIQRELLDRVTEGDKAASLYETKVNQNLLPLLRQTFGAAFTERDREALQKTLGDPFAHPDIKNETLKSFINNKRGEIEAKSRKLRSYSQPSLKQFNETPQYQEGMIAEDANGNRLIFRGGQWQQM